MELTMPNSKQTDTPKTKPVVHCKQCDRTWEACEHFREYDLNDFAKGHARAHRHNVTIKRVEVKKK